MSACSHVTPLLLNPTTICNMNEAAIKAEIARLSGRYFPMQVDRCSDKDTGAIDHHKSTGPSTSAPPSRGPRNHTYVNPNYKPPSRSALPKFLPATINTPRYATKPVFSSSSNVAHHPVAAQGPREVLIDGVAFRSSGRSLVRKDRA